MKCVDIPKNTKGEDSLYYHIPKRQCRVLYSVYYVFVLHSLKNLIIACKSMCFSTWFLWFEKYDLVVIERSQYFSPSFFLW